MDAQQRPVLALDHLSKFYASGQNIVVGLNDATLQFYRGEFVAITGESGSGKSTMAHVLGGILPYESGELYLNGQPTSHFDSRDWDRYRRDNISFISQSYGILPNVTVLENVISALRLSGMEKQQARQEAQTILEKVELWSYRRRRAARLSSGQKQRLSIARALAKPAPILIADEPTGNLDPENSAKIIDLLAQAAQDRLVLLITHEFSEAENQVTRRIHLQDSRITMDAALRPTAAPSAQPPRTRSSGPLSPYITRLQVGGRPVWASLVLLFYTLTAFAVFAFLGTYILSLDDSDTRIYDDSAFANGDKLRIVVQRIDGEPLTEEDYAALASVKYVDGVQRYGSAQDINYYYQDGVDYRYTGWLENIGKIEDPLFVLRSYLELMGSSSFVQGIPIMADGQDFLTAGRLPENFLEVVAVGDKSQIGETVQVFFKDRSWTADAYTSLTVTIVGVTDMGEGLYFHDLVLQVLEKGLMTPYVTTITETGIDSTGNPYTLIRTYYNYVAWPSDDTHVHTWVEDPSSTTESYMAFICPDCGKSWGVSVPLHSHAWDYADGGSWSVEGSSVQLTLSCNCGETLVYDFPDNTDAHSHDWYYNGTIPDETGDDFYLEYLCADCDAFWYIDKPATITHEHEWVQEGYTSPTKSKAGYALYNCACGAVLECAIPRLSDAPQDGEMLILSGLLNTDMSSLVSSLSSSYIGYVIGDTFLAGEDTYLTIVGSHDYKTSQIIVVSEHDAAALAADYSPTQAGLTLRHYSYTDKVLAAVQDMGYLAASPYRLGATTRDAAKVAERKQTLTVCITVLIAVLLLQVLLQRALFGGEMENYQMLANIGLSCGTAQRSVFWQVLLLAIPGEILGGAALGICAGAGIERVLRIVRYLTFWQAAGMVAVHLAAAALGALWVSLAVRRRVYPLVARKDDLQIDDEEAAV